MLALGPRTMTGSTSRDPRVGPRERTLPARRPAGTHVGSYRSERAAGQRGRERRAGRASAGAPRDEVRPAGKLGGAAAPMLSGPWDTGSGCRYRGRRASCPPLVDRDDPPSSSANIRGLAGRCFIGGSPRARFRDGVPASPKQTGAPLSPTRRSRSLAPERQGVSLARCCCRESTALRSFVRSGPWDPAGAARFDSVARSSGRDRRYRPIERISARKAGNSRTGA